MKASTASIQLILSARTGDQELSKAALKFNRLLFKLERVQEKKETLRNDLDSKLNETVREVLPVFQEWCELRAEFLIAIIHYILNNALSPKDEKGVLNYVEHHYQELMRMPIEFKQEIKEELQKAWMLLITGEEVGEKEEDYEEEVLNDNPFGEFFRERALDYVNEQLKEFGRKIEAADFAEGLSDSEWEAALREKMEVLNTELFGPKKSKKKSKKQLEREQKRDEVDAVKAKSFSALYKQLAKMLHPDGERNEQMREKKTEWMKKLTVAYKSKDIQTLLLLELEWLRTEKNEAQRLSDEKLEYMNAMLSEQVKEAERQLEALIFDPRYRILAAFAGGRGDLLRFQPKSHKRVLTNYLSIELKSIQQMQGSPKEAKRVLKEVIQEMKQGFVSGY